MFPSAGYVGEKVTIFLATDLTEGKAEPTEHEKIETRWLRGGDRADAAVGEGH